MEGDADETVRCEGDEAFASSSREGAEEPDTFTRGAVVRTGVGVSGGAALCMDVVEYVEGFEGVIPGVKSPFLMEPGKGFAGLSEVGVSTSVNFCAFRGVEKE